LGRRDPKKSRDSGAPDSSYFDLKPNTPLVARGCTKDPETGEKHTILNKFAMVSALGVLMLC
jgi:hypothetical protein